MQGLDLNQGSRSAGLGARRPRQACVLEEAIASFLLLQKVLKPTSIGDGHSFARPNESPRPLTFRPLGLTAIVLYQTMLNIFRHSNVVTARLVSYDVNLVHNI